MEAKRKIIMNTEQVDQVENRTNLRKVMAHSATPTPVAATVTCYFIQSVRTFGFILKQIHSRVNIVWNNFHFFTNISFIERCVSTILLKQNWSSTIKMYTKKMVSFIKKIKKPCLATSAGPWTGKRYVAHKIIRWRSVSWKATFKHL